MTRRVLPAFFSLLLLSGCALTPEFTRPAVDTPAAFSAGGAETQVHADWWRQFGSAELDRLVTVALTENNDLRAALQRIEQSRAAAKIAGAALLPAADISGDVSRARNNPVSGPTDNSTRIGLDAGVSYELDLFGRNRATVTAAKAGVDASRFDKAALDLVVAGDVAGTYFSILNTRERLAVADNNLANAREVLRIVQARLDAGAASGLELAQQQSAVASAEASRAAIVEALANAENALAVLLGKAPQTLRTAQTKLDGLTVPAIAPGQPSTLLLRRPDIQQAEAALVAANANIGVARAAFFPTVSLGLGGGVSMAGFGDPASSALSLASNLAAPLFQGGRLQGGVEQATARQAELAENYRKTVLVAFQEVEDALAAVRAAEARETSFAAARAAAQTAYDLSRERFDRGAIDFQTVIDAQGTLLSAEDSHTQSRNARLSAAIRLYLALGGGWEKS